MRAVLVPGLGLDGRSSRRLRERLPADVVLLPGVGLRAPVPGMDELAAALRARSGEGPVLLVGHPQGCQIAAAATEVAQLVVEMTGTLLAPPGRA